MIGWSKGIFGRLALLTLGVAAIVWLIREAGQDAVQGALLQAAAIIPILLVLEGGRIVCEAAATRRLAGHEGVTLPWSTLLRAQLISYSVCVVAPAGRTAGEAVKGAILSPYIGMGRATVIATTIQALTLLSNGLIALAAAAVALWVLGPNTLSWALLAYAVITTGAGVLLQLLSRSRSVCRWVAGSFPRLRRPVARFRRSAEFSASLPPAPAVAILGGRMLQTLQFGVLAAALGLGIGIEPTFIGQGLNLVSSAVGELVPAQLGVTDSAFAMGAASLGTTAAVGLSMAVVIHCVQLLWVAIGATLPLVWHVAQPTAFRQPNRPIGGPRSPRVRRRMPNLGGAPGMQGRPA